ncbi:hypothetical protein BRADI_5g10706v3 [Brachypodium distachyon]|uniref:Uncharacterized protein n=1 Tax=Brachypodium distachyon TaxID=15368 RepID=A0A0Q3I9E2_BRADI|nr:hypothetical protein BRADI_5g10706v3 [Brachypodium distachyon]
MVCHWVVKHRRGRRRSWLRRCSWRRERRGQWPDSRTVPHFLRDGEKTVPAATPPASRHQHQQKPRSPYFSGSARPRTSLSPLARHIRNRSRRRPHVRTASLLVGVDPRCDEYLMRSS